MDEVSHKITNICIPDGSEDYGDRVGWATGFGNSIFGNLLFLLFNIKYFKTFRLY